MTCPNSPDGHHLYLVYEKFGIRCEHCSHTLGWRDVLNYCNAAERLSAEDAFDASTRLYDVDYASIAEEWRDQNSKRQHESLHDYATHRKDE